MQLACHCSYWWLTDPWGGDGSIPTPDSEVKMSFVVEPYPQDRHPEAGLPASSCVLATTVSYSSHHDIHTLSQEYHGNRIPLPTVLWQPRSTTHNTVATTVC